MEENQSGFSKGPALSTVSFLGDINQDGFSELGIGYRPTGRRSDTSGPGRAFIIFGNSAIDNYLNRNVIDSFDLDFFDRRVGFAIDGLHHGFATLIEGIGDFNADGWDDFALGGTAHPDSQIRCEDSTVVVDGHYSVFYGGKFFQKPNPEEEFTDIDLCRDCYFVKDD